MPGTRIPGKSVADGISGGSTTAVTAGQTLNNGGVPYLATFNGRVGAFKAYAGAAGSGAGNTVLDVLINGTSIWAATSARPTLAGASTGEFTNAIGSRGSFHAGDRISVTVISIPATTGHSQLSVTVALQAA